MILHTVLGTQLEKPSFLYFFGMALVVFSARRIVDQRSERAKRVAAEHHAHHDFDARSADPIAEIGANSKTT